MPIQIDQIEQAEYRYFITIKTHLLCRIKEILKFLNSRIKILDDWKNQFLATARRGYQQSDLDIGAERVFHNFASLIFRNPNSTPIGSDIVFDSDEGYRIHIDIKTALINNPADYNGKINIGKNQTSYSGTNFNGNLPTIYNGDGKITLTYVIQIIHEHLSDKIHAIILASIPNGLLYEVYGDNIIKAGKGGWNKAKDFRFAYIIGKKVLKFRFNNEDRVEIITLYKKTNILRNLGLKVNYEHDDNDLAI